MIVVSNAFMICVLAVLVIMIGAVTNLFLKTQEMRDDLKRHERFRNDAAYLNRKIDNRQQRINALRKNLYEVDDKYNEIVLDLGKRCDAIDKAMNELKDDLECLKKDKADATIVSDLKDDLEKTKNSVNDLQSFADAQKLKESWLFERVPQPSKPCWWDNLPPMWNVTCNECSDMEKAGTMTVDELKLTQEDLDKLAEKLKVHSYSTGCLYEHSNGPESASEASDEEGEGSEETSSEEDSRPNKTVSYEWIFPGKEAYKAVTGGNYLVAGRIGSEQPIEVYPTIYDGTYFKTIHRYSIQQVYAYIKQPELSDIYQELYDLILEERSENEDDRKDSQV